MSKTINHSFKYISLVGSILKHCLISLSTWQSNRHLKTDMPKRQPPSRPENMLVLSMQYESHIFFLVVFLLCWWFPSCVAWKTILIPGLQLCVTWSRTLMVSLVHVITWSIWNPSHIRWAPAIILRRVLPVVPVYFMEPSYPHVLIKCRPRRKETKEDNP